MRMHAPKFWAHDAGGIAARLLSPLGALYGFGTAARISRATPWRAPVKVLSVGNLTAGGAGKTPVAIDLAGRLIISGVKAHFLTRGYGGKVRHTERADPSQDTADQVGDEALMLAAIAPTWVGRDRAESARAAVAAGARALIMDDAHQNPGLVKDLSLVVIDGGFGFGNGRLIPAGPLRERVEIGLSRANAVVVIDEDTTGAIELVRRLRPDLPIHRARFRQAAGADRISGCNVIAFAGIARPEKFFETVRRAGGQILHSQSFPDHHPYFAAEVDQLKAKAKALDALLVTTAKDIVRLKPTERKGIEVLTITLQWEDEAAIERLLTPFRTA